MLPQDKYKSHAQASVAGIRRWLLITIHKTCDNWLAVARGCRCMLPAAHQLVDEVQCWFWLVCVHVQLNCLGELCRPLALFGHCLHKCPLVSSRGHKSSECAPIAARATAAKQKPCASVVQHNGCSWWDIAWQVCVRVRVHPHNKQGASK